MGYFKYYEDIVEAREEAKYFNEANEAFKISAKEEHKKKLEPIFMRYFVLKKIYYELIYKINSMNNLIDLKSEVLLNFLDKEKYECRKNQDYLLQETSKLFDYLTNEDFEVKLVPPLSIVDKHRIRHNICDLVCNYAFSYMNEEKYMDVRKLIIDIDALSYWAEKPSDGLLTFNNPGFIKTYISKGEFEKRRCIHCGEITPSECCYCLNCGALIGVE